MGVPLFQGGGRPEAFGERRLSDRLHLGRTQAGFPNAPPGAFHPE